MLCEIARKLDGDRLETLQALRHDLGLTLAAFSCRRLDPARETKFQTLMDGLGPQLRAQPAEHDDVQLGRIREAEETLGLSLVAVRAWRSQPPTLRRAPARGRQSGRLSPRCPPSSGSAPLGCPSPCLLYTSPSPRDRQKSRMP